MGSESQTKDLERRILVFCRDNAAKPALDKGIKEVVAISEEGIKPEYSEGPNLLEEEVRQTFKRNPENQVAVVADLMDLESSRGIDLYESMMDLPIGMVLKGDMADVQDPEQKKTLIGYLSPDSKAERKARLALANNYEDVGTMIFDMDVFDVLALPDPDITMRIGEEQGEAPKGLGRIRNVLYVTRGQKPKMIDLIKKYNLLQSSENPVVMHFIAGSNSNILEQGTLPSDTYNQLENYGPYEAIVLEKRGVSKEGDEVEFSDEHVVAKLISGLKAGNGMAIYLDENAEEGVNAPMGFRLARTEMDIVREFSPYTQKELQRATEKAKMTADEKNITLRKPQMNILKLPVMTLSTDRDDENGLDMIVNESADADDEKTEEAVQLPPQPAPAIPPGQPKEVQPDKEYTEKEIYQRLWTKCTREEYKDLQAGQAAISKMMCRFGRRSVLWKNYLDIIEVISRDDTKMPTSREGFADMMTDIATLVGMYHKEWSEVGGFVKSVLESNADDRYRSLKRLAKLCQKDSTGKTIVDDDLKPLITGMLSSLAEERTGRAVDDMIAVIGLSEYIHQKNERMLFLSNLGAHYKNETESRNDPVAFANDLLRSGKFWTVSDEPAPPEPIAPEIPLEAPAGNGAPVLLDTPKEDYVAAARAAQAEIEEMRANGKKKPPRPAPSKQPEALAETSVPRYMRAGEELVDSVVNVATPAGKPEETSTLESELFSDRESDGVRWNERMRQSMGLSISAPEEVAPVAVPPGNDTAPEQPGVQYDCAGQPAIEEGKPEPETLPKPDDQVQATDAAAADDIRERYSLDALASQIDGDDGRFEARVADMLGPRTSSAVPAPAEMVPEPARVGASQEVQDAYEEEPVKVEEIEPAKVEDITKTMVEEVDVSGPEPGPEERPVAHMQLNLLEAGKGQTGIDAHPYATEEVDMVGEAVADTAEDAVPACAPSAEDDYKKPIGGIEMEDEKKEAPKKGGLGWLAVPALLVGLGIGAVSGVKYRADADKAALEQYNKAVVGQVMTDKAHVRASDVLKMQAEGYVRDQTEGFFGVDQVDKEGLEKKMDFVEGNAKSLAEEVTKRKNIYINKDVRDLVLEDLYRTQIDFDDTAFAVPGPAIGKRLNLMDIYLGAIGLRNIHGDFITPAEFVAMSNDRLTEGLVEYAQKTAKPHGKSVRHERHLQRARKPRRKAQIMSTKYQGRSRGSDMNEQGSITYRPSQRYQRKTF